MKGHMTIRGKYKDCKPLRTMIRDVERCKSESLNYDEDIGDCRLDYFYDDYDDGGLDLMMIGRPEGIEIDYEQW